MAKQTIDWDALDKLKAVNLTTPPVFESDPDWMVKRLASINDGTYIAPEYDPEDEETDDDEPDYL